MPNNRAPGEASAQSVSRALRAAGFAMIADHSREGMRVRQGLRGLGHVPGLGVSVIAQYGIVRIAERCASDAAEALRAAGYAVELNGVSMTVSKVSPSGS